MNWPVVLARVGRSGINDGGHGCCRGMCRMIWMTVGKQERTEPRQEAKSGGDEAGCRMTLLEGTKHFSPQRTERIAPVSTNNSNPGGPEFSPLRKL